ncbi:MAG: hypothetical protein K2R98_20090 [Gemmataceae bacterium]|nr:hypothetical protein [Gemmataceae bacterium]
MNPPPLTSRFADYPRWAARLVLLLAAIALAVCVFVSLSPPLDEPQAPAEPSEERENDWTFYRDVVKRVHDGESYYDVLPSQFQKRKYTPFSIFNFRTPIYAWFLGSLPDPVWGQLILCILALAAMGLTYAAVRWNSGALPATAAVVCLTGGLAWCAFQDVVYAQEMWAAVLITLSIAAYGLDWWPVGLLAALAALFFRELSLVYCAIAFLLALRERRIGELACWLIGLAAYGAFMAIHSREVARLIPEQSSGQVLDWVRFGGVGFLLGTTRMNFFLAAIPLPGALWVTAVYLPLAMLGLAGWRGAMGTRTLLTVGAYLAAFSVVGQDFNKYWGLMYTPLLTLGLVWLPASVRDLLQAASSSMTQEERRVEKQA